MTVTRFPAVLGLDTSLTRAGIAIIGRHDTGIGWPWRLTDVGHGGTDDEPYHIRNRRIVTQVNAIRGIVTAAIDDGADIELGVIEGPAYGQTSGKAFDRAAVWWGCYAMLTARKIPLAIVTPSTREKFITGVGSKGNKELVLSETRSQWKVPGAPTPICRDTLRGIQNHDQADAFGLAHMGALKLGWELPIPTRRRHVENMHAVAWPDLVIA